MRESGVVGGACVTVLRRIWNIEDGNESSAWGILEVIGKHSFLHLV
jgi:hypothetical protein